MKLNSYSYREGDLFLFCGYREHDYTLFDMLTKKFNMIMVNTPQLLTKKLVDTLKPKILFFPNWSWKVPKEIVDNYCCICFHQGDLPRGRGGSPIQNHIVRGIHHINTTAYIMNDRIDAGPILCKEPLSLEGSLNDIFKRIVSANYKLTCKIIENNIKAIPQDDNEATYYDRRKPEDSLIDMDKPIEYLYDFIRMLADPYPNAYINVGNKCILFKSAKMVDNKITVEGEINNL